MRKQFANYLFDLIKQHPEIYLIVADLGFGLWDDIRDTYPNNFFNVGSSEMVMMGTGIGLAMENKIPFVYSITPFAIYRPFEMIRNYVNHEKIPVNIIGGGRNNDYGYLGFSHWAHDDKKIMSVFDNISIFHPENNDDLKLYFKFVLENNTPTYINLKK